MHSFSTICFNTHRSNAHHPRQTTPPQPSYHLTTQTLPRSQVCTIASALFQHLLRSSPAHQQRKLVLGLLSHAPPPNGPLLLADGGPLVDLLPEELKGGEELSLALVQALVATAVRGAAGAAAGVASGAGKSAAGVAGAAAAFGAGGAAETAAGYGRGAGHHAGGATVVGGGQQGDGEEGEAEGRVDPLQPAEACAVLLEQGGLVAGPKSLGALLGYLKVGRGASSKKGGYCTMHVS